MRLRESIAIVVSLLLTLVAAIASAQTNTPHEAKPASRNQTNPAITAVTLDPFPGGVGSYWIYEGVVRQGSDEKPEEKKVRWRMSLERVIRRPGATAVIVKGFPGDPDWFGVDWSSTPPAKESMFVTTDDGGIYQIYSEKGIPDAKFTDPCITTQEFLRDEELLFQWPPTVGAQPGGGNCPERSDEMYCWVLFEAPGKGVLRGVKGIKPGSYTGYSLVYRTNPDDTEIGITSGVGVTAYEYHHHGTVADIELHLVGVHLAGKK